MVNVKRRRDMTIMDGTLATKLQCHPDGTLISQLYYHLDDTLATPFELRFYVTLDTKYIISETYFTANLLP